MQFITYLNDNHQSRVPLRRPIPNFRSLFSDPGILNHAPRSETLQDFQPGAVEPSSHSAYRPPYDFGNGFVRASPLMKEHKNRPIFRPHRLERRLDLTNQLRGVIIRTQAGQILEVSRGLRSASTTGHKCAAAVHCDTHDPRLQRPGRIPSPQAAKDTQQYLLRRVFGFVPVAQQPHAQAKDIALESLNQLPHSIRLAAEAAVHQLRIFDRHVRLPLPRRYSEQPSGVSS
jgi:hypothetical protein